MRPLGLRVTTDTNILISGLNFRRGKPFQFLELARAGTITVALSDAILDLVRQFDFTPEDIVEARSRIRTMARIVKPSIQLNVIKEDPPDDRILECAVAAGSDYIVTGDKDLLRFGRYEGIRIINVSDFLDVVYAQARKNIGRTEE